MTDQGSKTGLFLVGITLFALALHIVFLLAFDNVFSLEGESYSKINLVQAWIAEGKGYPDVNFGPLHTWIIYLLHLIFSQWIWPIRIFGVICGTLSVPLFYLLVREEFGHRAAVFSSLMFAVFPLRLRATPTGLTEVPYLLFFLAGLYAFVLVKNAPHPRWGALVGTAAGLTLAGMLRFEAWLYLPILCLILVRRRFWMAVVFGLLCAIFPLVHMSFCYRATGAPFSFFQTAASAAMQYMPMLPMGEKASGLVLSFWNGMGPPAAVLAVLGILLSLNHSRYWTFFALLFFPLALLQYKAMTNTFDPSLERYFIGMAALAYPYAALALIRIGTWAVRRRETVSSVPIIAVILIMFVQTELAWGQALDNSLPDDVRAMVQWLKKNATPADRILPDQRLHPYVLLESGLPYKSFLNLEWISNPRVLNEKAYDRMLAQSPPTMMIFDYSLAEDPDNMVRSNLDVFKIRFAAPEADLRGLHFQRIYLHGNFVIYRTRKAP